MTAPPDDAIGSAADEAAKLLGTIRSWVDDHLATGGSECQICPLCQVIGAFRESRPEVVAHLSAAGLSLAAAVRAFFDGAESRYGASGRARGVEHIDIAGDEA
jgi:hypothetical protein